MAEEGTIEVKVEHVNNLRNRIITDKYAITTDEPVEAGGGGSAPNPIELLLGAEGSCTVSVLMMFAKRMKYDLRGVEITLVHKRVRAEELKAAGVDTGLNKGYVHKIEKNIKFTGNLDEDQIEELRLVSQRCPVHNMIAGRSYFDISFAYNYNNDNNGEER